MLLNICSCRKYAVLVKVIAHEQVATRKSKSATMLFTLLNVAALIGWTGVLTLTAAAWLDSKPPSATCLTATLICECICCVDVVRIVLGQLRGDLILALDVHFTRLMMCFYVMPHPDISASNVILILLAWSLTEVARYPMVLCSSVSALKTIRYAVPLVTFPLGAGTEAYAAYSVLITTPQLPLKVALGWIVVVNCIGPPVWYPSMIAKVTRSLKTSAKKEATD